MTEQNLEKYLVVPEDIRENSFFYDRKSKKIGFKRFPELIEEEKFHSDYWKAFIEAFPNKIKGLTFYYEENPKKVPLTKYEKLRNYFGANIKFSEIEGEIKEYSLKPYLISNEGNLVRIITGKKEFEDLKNLSKNTEDIKTKYVNVGEPACYNSLIQRSLIKNIELKEEI